MNQEEADQNVVQKVVQTDLVGAWVREVICVAKRTTGSLIL